MSGEHKKTGWVFWFAAFISTVVALMAFYVGSYVWMVKPVTGITELENGGWRYATAPLYYWWPGKEADAGEVVDLLFDPLYRLDRLVRPKKWEPVP